MSYAIVGDPIVGLEVKGKRLRPASGDNRIVGIANENIICLVPHVKTVTDVDVHRHISPIMLARHDSATTTEADAEDEQRMWNVWTYLAAGAFLLLALALLGLALVEFILPYLETTRAARDG